MSSTQHQLIEQCATRLRGIVEALDNIHGTSPHRWSTGLDDVHSSAESLLALIKDQAPARSEASFEEWLANELEGEDGQPVPAAVCDIALARRAFNHWPKLEQPAKVGGVRFSAGVSSRLVVEAAQRLYEFESTPEKEAERIDPEQESVEQAGGDERAAFKTAYLAEFDCDADGDDNMAHSNTAWRAWKMARTALAHRSEFHQNLKECADEVANWPSYKREALAQPSTAQAEQAEVKRLREENANLILTCASLDSEKREMQHKWDAIIAERDAALARVAELERQEPVALANRGLHAFWVKWTEAAAGLYGPGIKLYAAPVAQAQQLNDLDKQCRDDVARALGLRPNQERGFAWSYLLASIKSCVKASEDSAQAQHSVPGDIMRDAQRYRWLRDQQFYFSFSTENSDAGISSCTAGMSSRFKNLSWVDAAIDSAIAAAPGKEGV
ncbi:hypothetical protein [Pseudomonas aeruginosa]|nr:hypothetical protein [Pseudomonas aeruginosa]